MPVKGALAKLKQARESHNDTSIDLVEAASLLRTSNTKAPGNSCSVSKSDTQGQASEAARAEVTEEDCDTKLEPKDVA